MTDQQLEQEERLDRFERTLEAECRDVWARVYAAVVAAHASPTSYVTGSWSPDSSGSMSSTQSPGHCRPTLAAEEADVAVVNYRTMVANRMRRQHAPYIDNLLEKVPEDNEF